MNETEKQIKEASENRRYDPQKHLETLLAIRDAVWIEGEEYGRYKCERSYEVEERTGQTRVQHEKDEHGS